MDNTFGAFKTSLSKDLTIEICRNLCGYFEISDATTEAILENKPPGLEVLHVLQRQGHIESKNVQKLQDAFQSLGMDALAKRTEQYQSSQEPAATCTLPDNLDSDEDLDVIGARSGNMSFEDFKIKCGLTETLTLNKMLEIKCPSRKPTTAEIFWEQITSLDYRITSSDTTLENSVSVRDLIFAILHCSDSSLRQDIVAKMSSCQLAVPLILNGTNNGKPIFLYWAMRTIKKKIKTLIDKDPVERPIYNNKMFTVSFLRCGDIRVSKSDLLNSLLSECQGNQAHSFFTSKKDDLAKPTCSYGTIEAAWYIPETEDDKGYLENTTAFLNLRGDLQKFKSQTEFLCKVSNLVFVLIGRNDWKTHTCTAASLSNMAAKALFIAIKEADDAATEDPLDLKHEQVILVRRIQIKVLNREICRRINECQKSSQSLWSLENYKENVQNSIEVDISDEHLSRIEEIVQKIVPKQINIKQFKDKILRLSSIWRELVRLDEITYKGDFGTKQQRSERKKEENRKRERQIATNISDEVKGFWELLSLVGEKGRPNLFDDCLIYLETLLFDLTHMHQGIFKSDKNFLRDRLQNQVEGNPTKMGIHCELRRQYLNEAKIQWQMCIGIEDFIRELGQLFEAHTLSTNEHNSRIDVRRLPALAAQFIARGNSLEIMDDKSYCVPVYWICNILEQLGTLLGENAKVCVLSVIGVQGSGKSTLLNSMFGTNFPVSAGRCTRGIFLRLLRVEKSFATSIGCNYMIVVDTEGLKADHGGLDEASSTLLDNKMVTLAMCIADLIIVNVEGENIGSDMTKFLQIAAYAVIRMKEVDLQSQCRIIQQRVSDITAPSKNQNFMLKFISDLDKAVHDISREQDCVYSYESFSDIFDLNVDYHTQYVCNLWSGNMDPPNHLYGKAVIKFKEKLLRSITDGALKIHFTFDTFCSRLFAVHTALKEENFVLNFQDVSAAIAYNELSLQCNRWLCDVRIKIMEKWLMWQRKMRIVEEKERDKLSKNLEDELSEELSKHEKTVTKKFESYLQNNKNTHTHTEHFRSLIKADLSKIESDMQIKFSNEAKALQWAARDVPSFVAREATRLREKTIEMATKLRESAHVDLDSSQLQQHFDNFWEDSINATLERNQLKNITKEDILEECTRILRKLCRDKAIETDVVRLLHTEGDILNHAKDFSPNDYIPNKTAKKKFLGKVHQLRGKREQMTKNVQVVVKEVKMSVLKSFETSVKSFDPYLVWTTLQKVLSRLTCKEDGSNLKFPSILIAKVLLHLCGTISQLSTTRHQRYHKDNCCQDLLYKHKEDICLEFRAFYDNSYQNDRAYEYIKNLISQQFKLFTLDNLRSRIIRYYCEDVIQTKYELHTKVLRYLLEENKPLLYLDYINNNVGFMVSWMGETMTHKLCSKEENMSWIEFQYQAMMKDITPISSSVVQEISKASSLKEWCETFSDIFKNQHGIQLDLNDALVYNVSNLSELSTKIVTFCQSTLFKETNENVQLPEIDNSLQSNVFLELTLNRPFEDVISNFLGCQAQCPFCKAPCSKENSPNHTHEAFCHYPRGLTGKHWETNQLVENSCGSSVASNDILYEKNGEYFLYKDYKQHYPSWNIPTKENDERNYWAWVFHNINDYCSSYYSCDPADIPDTWSSESMSKRARAVVKENLYITSRILKFWHKHRMKAHYRSGMSTKQGTSY